MTPGTGIVTLTTDFGTQGPYVAAMKGILLGMAPTVQLVDVCHTIGPQDILEGAFVLGGIVDAFPAGTVHLAVVDPGVGTDRRLIAVAMADQWFVLPDNGLITGAARGRTATGIWELTSPALRRPVVAPTFHGRDILAPAAAHLVRGGDPAELGPASSRFEMLRNFEPSVSEDGLIGEVIFRDTFGNLITNLQADRLDGGTAGDWTVEVAGTRLSGLVRTYGDRPTGTMVALIGSTGAIEIAVVNGDASERLSAGPGFTVRLRRKARPG